VGGGCNVFAINVTARVWMLLTMLGLFVAGEADAPRPHRAGGRRPTACIPVGATSPTWLEPA
jgi:hypothetical protein